MDRLLQTKSIGCGCVADGSRQCRVPSTVLWPKPVFTYQHCSRHQYFIHSQNETSSHKRAFRKHSDQTPIMMSNRLGNTATSETHVMLSITVSHRRPIVYGNTWEENIKAKNQVNSTVFHFTSMLMINTILDKFFPLQFKLNGPSSSDRLVFVVTVDPVTRGRRR